ncbi:MAG: DSD1 family PLP-dependent enzyme [Alphaproteobacteria bacterium]
MPRDIAELSPNAALIGQPGSRGRLSTPSLVLDLDILEANIAEMLSWTKAQGLRLRPHAKTHKSVQVAKLLVEAGAVGACCATLGEAEALGYAGVPGVLITSPVIQPAKIDRLLALNEAAENLAVVADDPANVAMLADAAAKRDGKPLVVFVDNDVGTNRTGVQSGQQATALAREIDAAPGLRFGGIQGYAGHLQHIVDFDERQKGVATVAAHMRQVSDTLKAAGLAPPLMTGGGTGTHAMEAGADALQELQAGSFTVMDVDYNRVTLREDGKRPFQDALFIATSVVSAQHDGQATTDGGLKSFATDGYLPDIARGAPSGSTYGWAGDEHGRITLPAGAAPLKIGDMLECVTPHCDPTVNLHDCYHVCRGDTLVDIWPVDARGKR